MSRTLRCAVYTRKSSEEGLDMAFNSLDAQREAGLDYIRSQRHQGWTAIAESYDDGGYSGGTTDRPGLQRLLADIDARRIDIVLVYKVDRLSRSLTDFARLMQRFDERGVSFVSVTQQFSTTTSMGRLTLNMLLSFAQFEREVAGERIRDKIAATVKKGVWVCGRPPLGYKRLGRDSRGAGDEHGMRIVPAEAAIVREIFESYAELHSLVGVADRLAARGRTTKSWISRGAERGKRRFNASAVYRVLTNPHYIGKVTHTRRLSAASGGRAEVRTEVYDGVHEPIVPRALWDKVHALMARAERETRSRWTHTHLLKGKIRTFEGAAMSPSAVKRMTDCKGKPNGRERRIGYYVSQKALKHGYATCPVRSVNSRHLDDVVRGLVLDYLASHGRQTAFDDPSKRDAALREIIRGVIVAPDRITIELDAAAVAACEAAMEPRGRARSPACHYSPTIDATDDAITLTLAVQIKRLDGRRMLLAPDGQDLLAHQGEAGSPEPNPTIVRAIGLAYTALRAIADDGHETAKVALQLGVSHTTLKYVLPLTQLGPAILRAALEGTLPPRMTVKRLRTVASHLDWQRQAAALRANESR
jgi:site-specific DNA recombinase